MTSFTPTPDALRVLSASCGELECLSSGGARAGNRKTFEGDEERVHPKASAPGFPHRICAPESERRSSASDFCDAGWQLAARPRGFRFRSFRPVAQSRTGGRPFSCAQGVTAPELLSCEPFPASENALAPAEPLSRMRRPRPASLKTGKLRTFEALRAGGFILTRFMHCAIAGRLSKGSNPVMVATSERQMTRRRRRLSDSARG